MNFFSGNSPLVKGLRTFVQYVFGFVVGLFTTVWMVPGVPEAVMDYVNKNVAQLLLVGGVSAGGLAWLWNALTSRKQ